MCAYSFAAIFVSKRTFIVLLTCNTLSIVLYLGIAWPFLTQTLLLPTVNWMAIPSFVDLARGFVKLWGQFNTVILLIYIGGIFIYSFHAGIKFLSSKLSMVSISIIGVSSLLPFIISQFKPVFIDTRTPMIFLPMAGIFIAVIISHLGKLKYTIIVFTLLIISTTISSIWIFTSPDPYPVRASVQYVLSRAKCGDTLLQGSLTYSEIEYYLRQLGTPNCLHRQPFPLDTLTHPGWVDVPGLLDRETDLIKEAKTVTAQLADQSGSTVWLFHSKGSRYGYDVTEYLRQELDQQLTLVDVLDLSGTYFDTVWVYSTD